MQRHWHIYGPRPALEDELIIKLFTVIPEFASSVFNNVTLQFKMIIIKIFTVVPEFA